MGQPLDGQRRTQIIQTLVYAAHARPATAAVDCTSVRVGFRSSCRARTWGSQAVDATRCLRALPAPKITRTQCCRGSRKSRCGARPRGGASTSGARSSAKRTTSCSTSRARSACPSWGTMVGKFAERNLGAKPGRRPRPNERSRRRRPRRRAPARGPLPDAARFRGAMTFVLMCD